MSIFRTCNIDFVRFIWDFPPLFFLLTDPWRLRFPTVSPLKELKRLIKYLESDLRPLRSLDLYGDPRLNFRGSFRTTGISFLVFLVLGSCIFWRFTNGEVGSVCSFPSLHRVGFWGSRFRFISRIRRWGWFHHSLFWVTSRSWKYGRSIIMGERVGLGPQSPPV